MISKELQVYFTLGLVKRVDVSSISKSPHRTHRVNSRKQSKKRIVSYLECWTCDCCVDPTDFPDSGFCTHFFPFSSQNQTFAFLNKLPSFFWGAAFFWPSSLTILFHWEARVPGDCFSFSANNKTWQAWVHCQTRVSSLGQRC